MGIVDIFITRQSAVYRLTQQGREVVLDVAPGPRIVKQKGTLSNKPNGTIGEKSGIRCDLSTMKFEPQTAIKTDLHTFPLGVSHFLAPFMRYISFNYSRLDRFLGSYMVNVGLDPWVWKGNLRGIVRRSTYLIETYRPGPRS